MPPSLFFEKGEDKPRARLERTRMFREIYEQPEILEKIWNQRQSVASLAKKISGAASIVFTAFGSSYNAALYGQVLFYHYLGIPSLVATPGFFLRPERKLKIRHGLLVAISQSGKVREVIEAVSFLKKTGMRTLAVTNDRHSPLAHTCDEVLPLEAGPEKSVPATKTFTATIFHLQLLAGYWGARNLLRELGRTAEICTEVLRETEEIKELSKRLAKCSRGFILSPESLKPIACEGGLKLNECAYLMTESFDWREFFHGPIASAQRETTAIFLADPGDRKATSRVAGVLKTSDVRAYLLQLPERLQVAGANLAAIPYSVLLQVLALYLALLKGENPDHPRLLHKITQTPLR